jgi:CheY-like chemotaxis protein
MSSAMSSATSPHPDAVPPDVKGATVLVVDDQRAWQLLLETDLLALGYLPILATNAAEALDRILEHDPAVAIVDLMLPPVDGWHLLSEMRARGTLVPTIFYSAYPMSRAENQHPDVVACVSKTADRASLYALLPSAIRRKKQEKPALGPGINGGHHAAPA